MEGGKEREIEHDRGRRGRGRGGRKERMDGWMEGGRKGKKRARKVGGGYRKIDRERDR